MEKEGGQYKCIVTGKRFNSCGGREAAQKGLADGVHTNVGFVSRSGLDRYDEIAKDVIGTFYLSDLGCARTAGLIRREIKRRLLEASSTESSTDMPS